ncbi:uncharacterized protein ACO6RY_15416 [Pungitius sinensis]
MDFPGHFQYIFQQLNQQRLCGQLCDCVVLVGPQSFRAHRSILAACSSHFRALLSSSNTRVKVDGPGSDSDGPCVIELDPEVVTPEAFSTLLDMIYTSTLSPGTSNVMDVLLAASHLHLNNVVKIYKLHLSSRNFPALPPKGWRSVQHATSVMEECSDEEEAGVELSQSGGVEDQGASGQVGGERGAAPFSYKRKSEEDGLGHRKKSRWPAEGHYKECLLTVTRSTSTEEGRVALLSTDPLKTTNRLWESRGKKKKKKPQGQGGEIQLPRPSNLTMGGVGVWKDGDTEGDSVVKIKVEKGELPKLIEGGEENSAGLAHNSPPPPPPPEHSNNNFESSPSEEKTAPGRSLPSQLCVGLQTDSQREAGPLGEGSVGVKSEGLSELALPCFLNLRRESVMGAREEGDRLASLTLAAVATASDAPAGDAGELCQNSEISTAQPSDSSLVFPVIPDPLQQLLPTPGPDFSDTPTQNPFPVSSRSRRKKSLIQPPEDGKSFCRMSPEAPGHEASPEDSSKGLCWTGASEDNVQQVKGERKYACKICCKTFVKFRQCKEHIHSHTSKTLSKV